MIYSLIPFLRYNKCMTIEQTVEIPCNHRLILEVPVEIPAGKAHITFTPVMEKPHTTVSLQSLRGSCKGLDTLDAYFARKRANKERENREI